MGGPSGGSSSRSSRRRHSGSRPAAMRRAPMRAARSNRAPGEQVPSPCCVQTRRPAGATWPSSWAPRRRTRTWTAPSRRTCGLRTRARPLPRSPRRCTSWRQRCSASTSRRRSWRRGYRCDGDGERRARRDSRDTGPARPHASAHTPGLAACTGRGGATGVGAGGRGLPEALRRSTAQLERQGAHTHACTGTRPRSRTQSTHMQHAALRTGARAAGRGGGMAHASVHARARGLFMPARSWRAW